MKEIHTLRTMLGTTRRKKNDHRPQIEWISLCSGVHDLFTLCCPYMCRKGASSLLSVKKYGKKTQYNFAKNLSNVLWLHGLRY